MTKARNIPSRAAAVAQFWCVHLRTAQFWLAHPGRATAPPTPPLQALDEPALMLAWARALPAASQAKLTRTFRARLDAFRLAIERGQPVPLPSGGSAAPSLPRSPSFPPPVEAIDPDWLAFQRDHAARQAAAPGIAAPLGAEIASLKLRCAYADYKIGLAQQRGDHASMREWTETLRHLSGVIHDEELRAQKLGREIGDILPRGEVERILRALPYWLNRSASDLLAAVCPAIASASSAPLYPEEVRAILEPHLLDHRLLAPFVRASQINAGNALPAWSVAAMRDALAAILEDGAALFDSLYATPPPAPGPLASPPPASLAHTAGAGI